MVPLAELLGESPGMVALREKVTRLLQNPSDGRRLPSVFIEGETGTGKSALARLMHAASPRRDGPFIAVNSAAIPETLVESHLFGNTRGAYTDAKEARPGFFQQANHGTLFLDEIALMSVGLQPKLLTAIEDRAVQRVGGKNSEPVDIWVVSASNLNVEDAIRAGKLREDLYHRMARVILRLPPLRERGDDILLLAEHFLERACREHGLPPKRLDADARGALLAYGWAGNVRQLENVIERSAVFAGTDVITARALELPTGGAAASAARHAPMTPESDAAERERMLAVWDAAKGNLSRAASELGIPRNTLRYRLEQLGLLPRRTVRGATEAPQGSPGERESVDAEAAAELRRLALLRVDLGGPPDDPTASRGGWIASVVNKVTDFGGALIEERAAGVVAAFGVEPVEDAPGRAAHTAIALQRAAERARAEGQDVRVKLAVDVRRCSIRRGAAPTLDEDARRDVWARLEALMASADPDTVVASEAAGAFIDRRFELARLELPVAARHRAYRIVGTLRPGLGLGRRVAAFVGRDHDLAFLRDRLAAVVRGKGLAVGIVGEAGIGKSRLVAEFRRSLPPGDVIWLEGACLSYARSIPYASALAILRQGCAISEADSTTTIMTKLSERLASLGMNVDESAPYLFQLFGLREGTERIAQLTSEAIRLRTLDIFRQMILGASAQRPVVVVVEDVHWADRASEEILDAIATDSAPVLLLSTYRPGFRPPSWMSRSFATQMALSRLSPEDSRTMLHSVVEEEIPESVARMILDKAEGNPFFLEEIYRAVEGLGRPGTLPEVPDSIADVLLARIERLPAGPKSVLQSAAVLGREFAARLLEGVWRGPGALEAHLAILTEQEFLYQRAGVRERAYAFKHALTQQVADESLTPALRRELHAAAGRALEELFADRLEEVYDRLAYHYARTEEATKAVDYLSGLAGKAARADAREEAVLTWKEALQHVERLAPDARDRRRLQIVLALANSLLPLGRITELSSLLLTERERLESLRDPALATQYYFILARMNMLGNHALVVDSARRAIAEAERCGDDATMGGAYGALAIACTLSGQATRGIECAQRAVSLLEKSSNQWSLSYAYWALGLCSGQLGQFHDALAAEERSLALAKAMGDAAMEVSAGWAMGIVRAVMGDWDRGIADCLGAVRAARDPLYRALATAFLGFAYAEKGDASLAIEALEQSIPLVHRFGLRAYDAWFTAFLAEAYRLAGHLERADALAESAVRTAMEASFPVGVGWAQLCQGRIAAARRDLALATTKLDAALSTFTATHSRYECGRTHLELAGVWRERGDGETARLHLRTAGERFDELGVPWYRERVERLATEWALSLRS
jgi:transcriptional regulator with AAA-type ATPase domain/tetratricopeptide (TPR) repeat protein